MGSVIGVVNEETPKYEVISTKGDYEVRRYEASYAIETQDKNGRGFMDLASYIGFFFSPSPFSLWIILKFFLPFSFSSSIGVMSAPQNDRNEKIAMTAPVVSLPDEQDKTMKMQFILPSGLI